MSYSNDSAITSTNDIKVTDFDNLKSSFFISVKMIKVEE